MSGIRFTNNAVTVLYTGISASATTCTLAPGTGELFPALASGQYFIASFTDAATRTIREIVQVTGFAGDTVVAMVRGQEGTAPVAWLSGDIFALQLTAGVANTFQPGIEAASGALLGGPPVMAGPPVPIAVGAGLGLAGDTLAVEFGTGSGQALQGSTLGAPGGPLPADLNGYATALEVIPQGSAAPQSLGQIAGAGISTAALVAALQAGRFPQGVYNAATNTPSLSAIQPAGYQYDVTVAGTPTIPGITTAVAIGDQIVSTGTTWYRIPFGGTYLAALNPTAFGILAVGTASYYGSGLPISFAIEDQFGNVAYYVDNSGVSYSEGMPAASSVASLYFYSQAGLPEGAVYWQDQFGNVSANTGVGSAVLSAQNSSTGSSAVFTQQDVDNSDLYGYGYSLKIRDQTDTTAQRPTGLYNVGSGYGQSEELGFESGPYFSDPSYDAFMYGGSVRSALINGGNSATTFTPVTDTTIRPIAATAQNLNTGALLPNRNGGFQSISSLVLANSGGTITLSAGATANMMQVSAGIPPAAPIIVSTAVGASGQPALDFTQILQSGDTFWLSCVSGNLYLVAGTITPGSITLMYGSNSLGASGTYTNVNLIVTNNGLGFIGQEPTTGILSTFSRLLCSSRYIETDPTKRFLGVNTAVGSQTIEALESGATPNLYNALISYLTQIKANGATRLIFEDFMQGGNNAAEGTTEQAYQGYLTSLVTTRRSAVMALLGQSNPHMFTISQLSGVEVAPGTTQAERYTIGIAQSDWITAGIVPSAYMVGPYNKYPGYGPHLSGNGERWRSEDVAKVVYKILALNQGWKHLQPVKAVARGSQIIITFHAPEPPLQGATVYHNMVKVTAAQDPTLGLAVNDASGVNGVASTEISDCSVVLNLSRAVLPNAYAPFYTITGGAASGYVLLKDSDPWVSKLSYVYQDYYGFNPAENFAELVGLPYDMSNYCPLFSFQNGVMG